MRKTITLALAGLWLSGAAPAEECGPLKILAQVQLQPAEDGSAEFVPVEIAGVTKHLLLDTGASATSITEKAAKDLGLKIKPSHFRTYSANGTYSDDAAEASIGIGALKGGTFDFQIAPFDFPDEIAGLLGADVLGQFDISIDFGTHKMDVLSQDHCDGRVKYWKGQPLAVIPITRAASGHIIIPVLLDDHRVNAILDTGASRSSVNSDAAQGEFRLSLGSADTPAHGVLNGEEGSTTWRHKFRTLTFEGVTVANPDFLIIPNRLKKHFGDKEPGSLISRPPESVEPDVLLGMNVLKHLHVYVAYKEKKVYITPAEEMAPSQPVAGAAAH
jgi:predicted aspartyl protease